MDHDRTMRCGRPECRYCAAAADYGGWPRGAPPACEAARQALGVADLAAFEALRAAANTPIEGRGGYEGGR
jgi:hypothetical protein